MVLGAPNRMRITNDRSALRMIVQAGALSRTELEKRIGMSKPAVADLLTRLETAGFVERAGKQEGKPGPSAQLWRIRAAAGHAVAVEVLPSAIRVSIAALDGAVVAETEVPFAANNPIATLATCVQSLVSQASIDPGSVLHAVVALPGGIDPRSGEVDFAPHLPGWEHYDVVTALRNALDMPVDVENDVNLMALSEMAEGHAKDVDTFAVVYIDDGVGAAIVVNRRLHRGVSGGAGEIDYLPVADQARVDAGVPRRGAKLGDLLSDDAILDLAQVHGINGTDAVLTIREATRVQETTAFIEDLGARIASGAAAIATVLDPELIVLAGRLADAGGTNLADEVRRQLARITTIPAGRAPRVVASPMTSKSTLAGASRLAVERARERAFEFGSVSLEASLQTS